jgi:hypothetical protein
MYKNITVFKIAYSYIIEERQGQSLAFDRITITSQL